MMSATREIQLWPERCRHLNRNIVSADLTARLEALEARA